MAGTGPKRLEQGTLTRQRYTMSTLSNCIGKLLLLDHRGEVAVARRRVPASLPAGSRVTEGDLSVGANSVAAEVLLEEAGGLMREVVRGAFELVELHPTEGAGLVS